MNLPLLTDCAPDKDNVPGSQCFGFGFETDGGPSSVMGGASRRLLVWVNVDDSSVLFDESSSEDIAQAKWSQQPPGTEYWFKPSSEMDDDVVWVEPKGLPKSSSGNNRTLDGFAPDKMLSLFEHSAVDDYSFRINPASAFILGSMQIFELVGIIMAKAIYDNVQLADFRFTSAFFKSLLALPMEMKDLESVDGDMYRSVKQVMEMPAEQVQYLCMSFAVGDTELEPGGMEKELTGENRTEWVAKVLEFALQRSVQSQRRAIATGFSRVLPLRELRALGIDAGEFELILNGLPSYDIADWRKHTEYPGHVDARNDKHKTTIRDFWALMRYANALEFQLN